MPERKLKRGIVTGIDILDTYDNPDLKGAISFQLGKGTKVSYFSVSRKNVVEIPITNMVTGFADKKYIKEI